MRSTRLILAVTALSAALALSACSDDGGGEDESSGSPSSAASESPTTVPASGCEADVKIDGAGPGAWKGKGYTSTSDGADLYRASKGKNTWVFVNVGEDSAELFVGVGGKNYPAQQKTVEVESTDDGVDATAQVKLKGGTATVTASFVCADA